MCVCICVDFCKLFALAFDFNPKLLPRHPSTERTCFSLAVLPQIVPFDFGSEEIFSLDTVSVSCTVSKGDSPVDIRWQFNGNHLTTNNGVLISRQTQRTSFLTIESVRDRHSGNYSCIAENPAGLAVHTASLFVNGLSCVLFLLLLLLCLLVP